MGLQGTWHGFIECLILWRPGFRLAFNTLKLTWHIQSILNHTQVYRGSSLLVYLLCVPCVKVKMVCKSNCLPIRPSPPFQSCLAAKQASPPYVEVCAEIFGVTSFRTNQDQFVRSWATQEVVMSRISQDVRQFLGRMKRIWQCWCDWRRI